MSQLFARTREEYLLSFEQGRSIDREGNTLLRFILALSLLPP